MDVVCPAGQSIKIAASTCEVEIKSQNGLKNVKFITMTAAPMDLTIRYELTKIAYTVTKDGFLCPFGGVGAKADGEYTTGMVSESMTLVATDPNDKTKVLSFGIK